LEKVMKKASETPHARERARAAPSDKKEPRRDDDEEEEEEEEFYSLARNSREESI
jgi:ribosomal protein L12E/L44/L45/RPP1/RPP2